MKIKKRDWLFVTGLVVVLGCILALKAFWKGQDSHPEGDPEAELKRRIDYAMTHAAEDQIKILKEIIQRYEDVKGIEFAYYMVSEQGFNKGKLEDIRWAAENLAKKHPGSKLALQAVFYLEQVSVPASPKGSLEAYKHALELRLAVLDALEREFPEEEFRFLRGSALKWVGKPEESERILLDYVKNAGDRKPYYPYKGGEQEGLLDFEVDPARAWMLLAEIYHESGREHEKDAAVQEAFESLDKANMPEEFRKKIRQNLEEAGNRLR